MAKKTKGRQKIQMAKIENEINLQATFSKRRSGLFKKASDLCILCGVEIAIVVFSPSKKAFCFGHPSVEMIADCFLKEQIDLPTTPQQQLMQAHQNASMYQLNTQLTYLESQLEDAKTKREELAKIRNERIMKKNPDWYDAPIESMGLHDLECVVWVLEYLKGEIDEKKKKVTNPVQMAGPGSSTTIYGLDQFTVTPHGLVLGNGHSGPWSSQDVDWSILGSF